MVAARSSPESGTESGDDAVWRERAIERSTRAARERAAKRVQQFLNSAREIIAEKESIEFTVQEVVDRSKQSLRSFYQYFDGKHELLLALFEEEMTEAVGRIKVEHHRRRPTRPARAGRAHPLRPLHPEPVVAAAPVLRVRPALLVTHPDEVSNAYVPLFTYMVSIVEDAAEANLLRPGRPRRQAAIVLQASTTTAGRSGAGRQPITGAEMWEFCLHAVAPDDVVARRADGSRAAAR